MYLWLWVLWRSLLKLAQLPLYASLLGSKELVVKLWFLYHSIKRLDCWRHYIMQTNLLFSIKWARWMTCTHHRVVTKISSCQINTTGGESTSKGFLLVLLFFFFPMKVTRDHIHRSWGKSPAPALNDRPVISCQRFYCSFRFFLNYASTSCASFYDV